jgi:hypothetical protein
MSSLIVPTCPRWNQATVIRSKSLCRGTRCRAQHDSGRLDRRCRRRAARVRLIGVDRGDFGAVAGDARNAGEGGVTGLGPPTSQRAFTPDRSPHRLVGPAKALPQAVERPSAPRPDGQWRRGCLPPSTTRTRRMRPPGRHQGGESGQDFGYKGCNFAPHLPARHALFGCD